MKENIVLNSHIDFLINQIAVCDQIPNLKRKYSYTLGAIRSLFEVGHLTRQQYFYYMKNARITRNNRQLFLSRSFWDNLESNKGRTYDI